MLSGGELQRVTIAAAYLKDGDVYLIDEPSSYLDVSERINMAKLIRSLTEEGKTMIVVEHDLAILDYMSDYVSIFYGKPSKALEYANAYNIQQVIFVGAQEVKKKVFNLDSSWFAVFINSAKSAIVSSLSPKGICFKFTIYSIFLCSAFNLSNVPKR